MNSIKVESYCGLYDDEIISNILTIQKEEFKISITIQDQPDLCNIKDFYQKGTGNFWIALCDGKVVGTLGLLDIGNNQGALRKMFVNKNFRGKKYNIAQCLLQELLKWSEEKKFEQVFLGTTNLFIAAHKFYRKNGFTEIKMTELPKNFPLMKVDSIFFKIDI